MLVRLVANTQPQVFRPPWPPKLLGLQALECNGMISAHCNHHLPGSSNSPASVSPGRDRFHHIGQVDVKLLTSGDLPTSASQSAEITGVSHCTQPFPGYQKQGDQHGTDSPSQLSEGTNPDNTLISDSSKAKLTPHLLITPVLNALIARVQCMISTQCNLRLPGSSESPASASRVFGTTGAHHHAR
ncbi:hypothetical protein AAY473_035712, partial [Plecturocebus cupreus]